MLCAFKSCSIWCQEAGLLKWVSRWLKRSSLKSSGSRLCAVRWLRVWRRPWRAVSTDTFRWSPSVTIEASQITAVHPQLSPRCVPWRGMCRSNTSGKPILTICPMRRATSSTRSVMITKSLVPRISWACCASCTLMAPSSPKLQVLWREHSSCPSGAQKTVEPKLRPLGNEAFGLFVQRMGRLLALFYNLSSLQTASTWHGATGNQGVSCSQKLRSGGLPLNWLQVFRRADPARLGSERRLQHQTRGVHGEKCVGLRASVWHSYA